MKLSKYLEPVFVPATGSAVRFPIQPQIDDCKARYKALLDSGAKFLHMTSVVIEGKNNYTLVHIKVPSETIPNFSYDVVFELHGLDGVDKVTDCHFRAFSNCPSFVYTYAYVYYHTTSGLGTNDKMFIDKMATKVPKHRLLTKGTEERLNKKSIKDAPNVRNPLGLALFDKSLYFALFYMMDIPIKELHECDNITDMRRFIQAIASFDDLMKERESLTPIKERKPRKHSLTDDEIEKRERKHHARVASGGAVNDLSKRSNGGVRKISSKASKPKTNSKGVNRIG